MAGKISIECPECDSKLSLADSSKLGKKIKCPKCGEIFVAEAPGDDDEEEEEEVDILSGMDDEDDGDDEEQEEAPRRKPTPGGKSKSGAGGNRPSKGGSSNKGGMNVPVIIGCVAGLIALIGGGIAVSTMSGGGGAAKQTAPAATDNAVAATADATPAPASTPTATPTAKTESAKSALPSIQKTTPVIPQSPTEKALGLRWMSADTELIIHAKISDLWKAPLLASQLNNPAITQTLEPYTKQVGIEPADVDSVTIGMCDLTEEMVKGFELGTGFAPGQPPPATPPTQTPGKQRLIAVVKLKKQVDWKKVSTDSPGTTTKESNGKTYYEADASQLPPGMTEGIGWWSPEPKTLIMGTTKELLATIERGETVIPRKEFAAINASPHLVMALVIPSFESNPKFAKLESSPAFAQVRDTIKPYALQMIGLGLSIKGGIDLQMTSASNTDDGSKKLKGDVDTWLKTARQGFDGFKNTAPPLIAELGEMVFKNLKLDEKSRVVNVATNIPNSAQEKLEQLPPILMMMAMTGGFGGPPGATPNGSPDDATLKMPGESDSVPPATSEGLPEGTIMLAKTRWSPIPSVSEDGKTSPTIDVMIDLRGPEIEKICGASGITAKPIKATGGQTLKRSKSVLPDNALPDSVFRPFDASALVPLEHPPQTLRVKLTVDAPKSDAQSIDLFEGSFKFITSENSQEITIENAPKSAKRPLTGPELKAADVKLRISLSSVTPKVLSLSCGKDYFISNVKAEETVGMIEFENERTWQRLISVAKGGEFAEELPITFKLSSHVKENSVAFRFENVPLPPASVKPAVEGKIPQLPEGTKLPDGMKIPEGSKLPEGPRGLKYNGPLIPKKPADDEKGTKKPRPVDD